MTHPEQVVVDHKLEDKWHVRLVRLQHLSHHCPGNQQLRQPGGRSQGEEPGERLGGEGIVRGKKDRQFPIVDEQNNCKLRAIEMSTPDLTLLALAHCPC